MKLSLTACLLGFILLLTAAPAGAEPVEARALRSPYADFLFIRDDARDEGLASVRFLVSINEQGRVTDAVAQDGDLEYAAAAGRAIRRGTYKPVIRDGVPVAVSFVDTVTVLPRERWGQGTAFPEGAPETIEIKLERGACFGFCPAYSITIAGNGRVTFQGDSHTAIRGQVAYWIYKTDVARLAERLRAADFFSLEDSYASGVTDLPNYRLTVTVGDRSKSVLDYYGLSAGMPLVVAQLEEEIDRITASERWIKGGGDPIMALKMVGWDFTTDNAAGVLACAAGQADGKLALGLLAEGTKATGRCDGISALVQAVRAGQASVARKLIVAGAALDLEQEAKNQLLFDAVWSGSLATVDLALSLDPELEGRGQEERTALMVAADAETAQHLAGNAKADLAGIVELLLRNGAFFGAKDANGATALHLAGDPAIAQALIDAGAKLDARDKADRTPLLTTPSEDVALLLLRAGADAKATGQDGATVAERAKELQWDRALTVLVAIQP